MQKDIAKAIEQLRADLAADAVEPVHAHTTGERRLYRANAYLALAMLALASREVRSAAEA